MRTARLLIALLVVAWAAVDLVVLAVMRHPRFPYYSFPDLPAMVVVALVFGQTGILAILATLGGPGSPRTWSGLFAGVILEALFLDGTQRGGCNPDVVLALMLYLFLQAAAVYGCLAWPGRAIRHRSQSGEGMGDANRPFQFTLARLFGWTTGVAVCLGLAQWALARTFDLSLARDAATEGLALAVSGAILAVAAARAVLRRRRRLDRGIALALAVLAAAWIVTVGAMGGTPMASLTLCILQTVVLIASLLVLRLAGYRFERRAR